MIFGSTEYTTASDVWSSGCVLAELLLGTPLFPGSSGDDGQMCAVITFLGSPTREELHEMNSNYPGFPLLIRASPWPTVFKPNTDPQAVDLVSKYLIYKPKQRYLAIESCQHPFFDELRDPATTIMLGPSGGFPSVPSPIPAEMFQFTPEEVSMKPQLLRELVPEYVVAQIDAELQSARTIS